MLLSGNSQVKHKVKMPMKMYMGVMKKRKEKEARKAEEERQSGVVTGKLSALSASTKRGSKKKQRKGGAA